MHEIRIEYKVGGLFKRSVRASIPEEYSEMTAKQFHSILEISRGDINEEQFVEKFFGVKSRLWVQLDKFYLYTLTELLRNLNEGHKVNFFFEPSLDIHGKKYLSPGSKLSGMDLQQFMSVDTFYGWYVYNEDKDMLVKFMSCLYIPEGEKFHQVDMDKQNKVFSKLYDENKGVMLDAVINWMLIHNWLCSVYRYLFPSSSDESENAKKSRPQGWSKFFDALIGENLANIDAYNRLECMDVLRITNRRIHEQQKLRK